MWLLIQKKQGWDRIFVIRDSRLSKRCRSNVPRIALLCCRLARRYRKPALGATLQNTRSPPANAKLTKKALRVCNKRYISSKSHNGYQEIRNRAVHVGTACQTFLRPIWPTSRRLSACSGHPARRFLSITMAWTAAPIQLSDSSHIENNIVFSAVC